MKPKTEKENRLTESLENLLAEKYQKDKKLEDPKTMLHPQCSKKPRSGLQRLFGRTSRGQKHRVLRQELHLRLFGQK